LFFNNAMFLLSAAFCKLFGRSSREVAPFTRRQR
jgi:hypothetical protein